MFCLTVIPLLLVPAAYRWWDGRRLRVRAEDAALAERWTAHVGRSTRVTLTCMLMVPMLCPGWAIPGMLGVVLLSRTAAYPLRRALFGETWSLVGYLDWSVRLFVAWAGYWTLLAWTPYLIDAAGRFWPMAAGVLAVALGVWQWRYPRVLLRTIRATPLDPEVDCRRIRRRRRPRSGCISRRDAVVVACRTARRRGRERSGPAVIGWVVRAFLGDAARVIDAVRGDGDLRARGRPSGALRQATTRRMMVVTLALIAGAVASAPLTARLAPDRMWIAITLWPVAVVGAMALRARQSQQHETASDRRAIALCGDPDALASALVKLHTLARIPRRWSPEMEQRATHPSLARRLRDIRAHAEGPPAPPAAPVIVRGADTGIWIVIEADRVRHLAGVPAGVGTDVPSPGGRCCHGGIAGLRRGDGSAGGHQGRSAASFRSSAARAAHFAAR